MDKKDNIILTINPTPQQANKMDKTWTVDAAHSTEQHMQHGPPLRTADERSGDAASFQIFLRGLAGKSIALEAQALDHVTDLKARICDKEGIPPHEQRLVYSGKQLADNCTLAAYGIQQESEVHVQLRLSGGTGGVENDSVREPPGAFEPWEHWQQKQQRTWPNWPPEPEDGPNQSRKDYLATQLCQQSEAKVAKDIRRVNRMFVGAMRGHAEPAATRGPAATAAVKEQPAARHAHESAALAPDPGADQPPGYAAKSRLPPGLSSTKGTLAAKDDVQPEECSLRGLIKAGAPADVARHARSPPPQRAPAAGQPRNPEQNRARNPRTRNQAPAASIFPPGIPVATAPRTGDVQPAPPAAKPLTVGQQQAKAMQKAMKKARQQAKREALESDDDQPRTRPQQGPAVPARPPPRDRQRAQDTCWQSAQQEAAPQPVPGSRNIVTVGDAGLAASSLDLPEWCPQPLVGPFPEEEYYEQGTMGTDALLASYTPALLPQQYNLPLLPAQQAQQLHPASLPHIAMSRAQQPAMLPHYGEAALAASHIAPPRGYPALGAQADESWLGCSLSHLLAMNDQAQDTCPAAGPGSVAGIFAAPQPGGMAATSAVHMRPVLAGPATAIGGALGGMTGLFGNTQLAGAAGFSGHPAVPSPPGPYPMARFPWETNSMAQAPSNLSFTAGQQLTQASFMPATADPGSFNAWLPPSDPAPPTALLNSLVQLIDDFNSTNIHP